MVDNQSQGNDSESRLRKAIQDIQADTSMDPATKARRMQVHLHRECTFLLTLRKGTADGQLEGEQAGQQAVHVQQQ